MDTPTWQFDELEHIVSDFSSPAEVELYDENMRQLRDIDGENAVVLASLDIGPASTILEIGAGTGEFAIAAARKCAKVYAVDASEAMVSYARDKAAARGVTNIEFACGGFLTYEHRAKPVDAVVTQLALHHLPDFWKAIALRRIWGMLRESGSLYLRDVVFSFDPDSAQAAIEGWMKESVAKAGDELGWRIARHVRDEDSTFDWIMEGLLRSTGFAVTSKQPAGGVFVTYLCRKLG